MYPVRKLTSPSMTYQKYARLGLILPLGLAFIACGDAIVLQGSVNEVSPGSTQEWSSIDLDPSSSTSPTGKPIEAFIEVYHHRSGTTQWNQRDGMLTVISFSGPHGEFELRGRCCRRLFAD